MSIKGCFISVNNRIPTLASQFRRQLQNRQMLWSYPQGAAVQIVTIIGNLSDRLPLERLCRPGFSIQLQFLQMQSHTNMMPGVHKNSPNLFLSFSSMTLSSFAVHINVRKKDWQFQDFPLEHSTDQISFPVLDLNKYILYILNYCSNFCFSLS